MRRYLTAVAAAGVLLVAGCSAAGAPTPVPGAAGPAPSAVPLPSSTLAYRPDHVVVVVLENKPFAGIVGSRATPYLNQLADGSALFTDSRAVTHPSQPNYLALFSGSTQGVTSDACPRSFASADNLGHQVRAAGLTFAGFSEDLPAVGYQGCGHGGYARKHNPWVDFANLPAVVNQPLTAWPADYAALPTVAFVIPNLCHDMHDCGPAVGDSWARAHLDGYLQWARGHNSLLVVTFDEDDHSAGNQIVTLFTGPMVTPGRYAEPLTHYRVLATLEHLYGLPALGSAAGTTPVTDIWRQ